VSGSLAARARRRARILRHSIRGPGDVWLALRMSAWRLALPLLKRALPLPRVARMMWSGRAGPGAGDDRLRRIVTLAHALSGPRRSPTWDNCLERSLLAYRFLSRAGAEPILVVGFAPGAERVRGHAWVVLDGESLNETPESLDGFAPVVAFGRDGAKLPPGATG
jgi:hypothetical protein